MSPADVLPPRLIGAYPPAGDPLAPSEGPVLVAICAAHGNEPAGVAAARAVLDALAAKGCPSRGRFIALVGNRTALARGVRYVDVDLNRLWQAERVAGLRRGARRDDRAIPHDVVAGPSAVAAAAPRPPVAVVEHAEQADLWQAMGRLIDDDARRRADGSRAQPIAFLDLHTTSGPSAPFAIALPTAPNRRLLAGIPLPLVHGLDGPLTGTLSAWLARAGFAAASVEGGRHDDPVSAVHLAHVLWLALANAGIIDRSAVDPAHAAALRAARTGRPRGLAVAYRHAIGREDGFRMRPGLASFQPVRKGAVLAETRSGPVTAPLDGVLLFPLYQGLGDDGFFIARRIATRWPRVESA